ncbi:hypothetical protein LC613_24395 [Nostoc sphaeroides CHAB 2801]|uniref:hypothetical protein n=1 Tax=Nostoc sphaeroides TaxID=446679 RepID=UPI001E2F4195|nr:hypothetical protein [Nostoc sphaeroides]MCC5630960.1 hypothetical protein [Nostoc sphaeroides CHAB 2801]
MSRDALVVGINTYDRLKSLNAPAADGEAISHQTKTNPASSLKKWCLRAIALFGDCFDGNEFYN